MMTRAPIPLHYRYIAVTLPLHYRYSWRLGRHDDSSAKFEPLQKLQAHATYVLKCLMSPDGKRLATCSADQTVEIYRDIGHPNP